MSGVRRPISLDDAYDYTGTGLGRVIDADAGAVRINNAVADASNGLEVNRTNPAGGYAIRVIAGDVLLDDNLTVAGNLNVLGATVTHEAETVLIADNHIYMNDGYTVNVAQTGGLVVNYLPTVIADTVNGAFVAGVPAVSDPTVVTTGAATFALGDLIQISGSNEPENDGLYEVFSHAANLLTIRGIGLNPRVEDFTQDQFTADATVAGAITQVTVSVIRAGTDGLWEDGRGAVTPIVFLDIAHAPGGFVTLDFAYDAGGAGVGRTINVDSGAVELIGSAIQNPILLLQNTTNPSTVAKQMARFSATLNANIIGGAFTGIEMAFTELVDSGDADIELLSGQFNHLATSEADFKAIRIRHEGDMTANNDDVSVEALLNTTVNSATASYRGIFVRDTVATLTAFQVVHGIEVEFTTGTASVNPYLGILVQMPVVYGAATGIKAAQLTGDGRTVEICNPTEAIKVILPATEAGIYIDNTTTNITATKDIVGIDADLSALAGGSIVSMYESSIVELGVGSDGVRIRHNESQFTGFATSNSWFNAYYVNFIGNRTGTNRDYLFYVEGTATINNAGANLIGFYNSMNNMTFTNANLVYGMFSEMPVAYTGGLDIVAIRATGDGRSVEICNNDFAIEITASATDDVFVIDNVTNNITAAKVIAAIYGDINSAGAPTVAGLDVALTQTLASAGGELNAYLGDVDRITGSDVTIRVMALSLDGVADAGGNENTILQLRSSLQVNQNITDHWGIELDMTAFDPVNYQTYYGAYIQMPDDTTPTNNPLYGTYIIMPAIYSGADMAGIKVTGYARTVEICNTTYAAEFTGPVLITGKLTVTGAIDPTHLWLDEQAGDPGGVANEGVIYTKDVSAVTELFYQSSDSTVMQVTAGGAPVVTSGRSLLIYNGANTEWGIISRNNTHLVIDSGVGGLLQFDVAGTTELIVDGTNATFGVHVLFDADNTYDIGASAGNWAKDIFTKGTIYFDTTAAAIWFDGQHLNIRNTTNGRFIKIDGQSGIEFKTNGTPYVFLNHISLSPNTTSAYDFGSATKVIQGVHQEVAYFYNTAGTESGSVSRSDDYLITDAGTGGAFRDDINGEPVQFTDMVEVTTNDAVQVTNGTVTLDADNVVYEIEIHVQAMQTDGSARSNFILIGTFYRDGAGATQEGATTSDHTVNTNGYACVFDTNGNDVRVRITGLGATDINWKTQTIWRRLD